MVCLFTSCEADIEEDVIDSEVCGVVQKHDIFIDAYGYNTYYLMINYQTIPVDFDTFYGVNNGTYICLD